MLEEIRVLIRVSLFAATIATVYWFVTYEITGTILLAGIAVSGGLFVAVAWQHWRPKPTGPLDVVGFADGPAGLDVDEGPIVHASGWPGLVGLAAVAGGLGLVFGPWFWLPGAALGLLSLIGWLTQLER